MKKLLCYLLLAFIGGYSNAQLKELSIGDELPVVDLEIINFATTKAKTSDFKGKLLILDFWATWCGPCVAEFPKLDSLQKQYKQDVQILSVSYEPKKVVETFMTKYTRVKKVPPRTTVTGDSVLRAIFKHSYLPHYVWINAKGKVIAITAAEYVTGENIAKALASGPIGVPLKKDDMKTMDRSKAVFNPLLHVYDKQPDNQYTLRIDSFERSRLLMNSTFTKHIPGIAGYGQLRPDRITYMNATIENLYSSALGRFKTEFMYSNRSIWEVSDSALSEFRNYELFQARTTPSQQATWKKDHTFCYEMQVPFRQDMSKNFDFMVKDLNNFFGLLYNIEGVMEKRKVKALVLVRTSNVDKLAVKDKNAEKVAYGGMQSLKVVNMPIETIIEEMRNPLQGYFLSLIDETGYTGMVEVDITGELSELNVLNSLLEKYDLKFVEKEVEIDMVIVRTKKN